MDVTRATIQHLTKNPIKTRADLEVTKRKIAKIYKAPCPSHIQLLKAYHELVKNKRISRCLEIESLLRIRPVRSLSGIVNISVLTKPYPCPGKCIYCPVEKGIPKSYVSGEPAVERAKKLSYDPYSQVKQRIEMLKAEGHSTDKIELRIVGGTWDFYPKRYQAWFIKKCFQACNQVSSGSYHSTNTMASVFQYNEKAKHRIVGLSIETRPDFINPEQIRWLRKLGVTMVELGVQSIYDDVLKLNRRGHRVKETIKATKLLKDAGFKVLYQMMPNLPGSKFSRDLQTFKQLFSNPQFRPDLLKIYPCALIKETPLYKLWQEGKFKPYTEKQLVNLIKSIKKIIPSYVRIQRITRDIPSQSIAAGPAKISNLRQTIAAKAKKEGWRCHCIRCREVKEKFNPKEKLYLFRKNYPASGGKEIFLSFENKNRTKLYSLLRLRILESSQEKVRVDSILPILKNAAIIREVHTYGQLQSLQSDRDLSPQHKGLGKKLIKEAETIAKKEFGLTKMSVISGVGVRDYYRKLGYKLQRSYMIKKI